MSKIKKKYLDFLVYEQSEITTISGDIVSQIPSDYISDAEMTTISGDVVAQIPDVSDFVTDAEITTISGNIVSQFPIDFYNQSEVDTISGSLHTEIDDHITSIDDAHDATAISVQELGEATYDDVQDFMNFVGERTFLSGGLISEHIPADGTIDIAPSTVWCKTADDNMATASFLDFPGVSGVALTDLTTNYVFFDYNEGVPQILISTDIATYSFKQDHIIIGTAYREGNEVRFEQTLPYIASGHNVHMAFLERFGVGRVSGMVTSDAGTRHLDITAGVGYRGMTRLTTNAFDTTVSGGDTFSYWYYDGDAGPAAWVEVAGYSQIDNFYYNDIATGLAELTLNRYGIHWVFMEMDGNHFHIVLGQGDYTAAEGLEASVPELLPNVVSNYSILIAKIGIQKNSDAMIIYYPWTTVFTTTLATIHGNLAGLGEDDHLQYHNDARGDERYYQQSEVDALTWTESDITDLDKYTQAEVTTISGDIVAQIPTDYVSDAEMTTISGDLQSDINSRIVSNPGSGEYRITNIRLDADLKIVVTYDTTPEP